MIKQLIDAITGDVEGAPSPTSSTARLKAVHRELCKAQHKIPSGFIVFGPATEPCECLLTEVLEAAIANGEPDCVRFIHDEWQTKSKQKMDCDFVRCLTMLLQRFQHRTQNVQNKATGEPAGINPATYDYIAEQGLLESIKWMHEHGVSRDILQAAVRTNRLDYIKYVLETFPPSKDSNEVCQIASSNKNVQALKLLHEHGCKLNDEVCESSDVDCLKYARAHGCAINLLAYYRAVLADNVECLAYLHENAWPWKKLTCELALFEGKLDCLKYAIKHGCPIDQKMCRKIVYGNAYFILYPGMMYLTAYMEVDTRPDPNCNKCFEYLYNTGILKKKYSVDHYELGPQIPDRRNYAKIQGKAMHEEQMEKHLRKQLHAI